MTSTPGDGATALVLALKRRARTRQWGDIKLTEPGCDRAYELVELLVSRGSDASVMDRKGQTAPGLARRRREFAQSPHAYIDEAEAMPMFQLER